MVGWLVVRSAPAELTTNGIMESNQAIWENCMSKKDILLVMTVVNLITGNTPSVSKVDSAYESAIKSFERHGQPPKEVRISRAIRRD